VGVEVGVAIGQLSECLLMHPRLALFMIDSWADTNDQPEHYRKSGDTHSQLSGAEQVAHMETARKVVEFAGSRANVVRQSSLEAAEKFPDGSMDFVFIDADHSYEGCRKDIYAWKPKVKKGGYLCGHDYNFPSCPGVKEAVDEAVSKNKWKLELGDNYTWFVKL